MLCMRIMFRHGWVALNQNTRSTGFRMDSKAPESGLANHQSLKLAKRYAGTCTLGGIPAEGQTDVCGMTKQGMEILVSHPEVGQASTYFPVT